MEELITVGEFARLARTTPRTLHWYEERGILRPHRVRSNRYRVYKSRQILDFQVILLLRKLGFSIAEIKRFLRNHKNPEDLLRLKKQELERQLKELLARLKDTQSYYENLKANGTLIRPTIKKFKPFWIYYTEKEGPYAKIKDFDFELKSKFEKISEDATFLTLFLEREYQPKKSKMKIAVVYDKSIKLKKEAKGEIKKEKIPGFKALSYKHYGTSALLSLLWQELEKYARKRGYKVNRKLPFIDLEFYIKDKEARSLNKDGIVFEINLPILQA